MPGVGQGPMGSPGEFKNLVGRLKAEFRNETRTVKLFSHVECTLITSSLPEPLVLFSQMFAACPTGFGGPKGIAGDRGAFGTPGRTGPEGERGGTGGDGRKGVKGDRGDPGPPGRGSPGMARMHCTKQGATNSWCHQEFVVCDNQIPHMAWFLSCRCAAHIRVQNSLVGVAVFAAQTVVKSGAASGEECRCARLQNPTLMLGLLVSRRSISQH